MVGNTSDRRHSVTKNANYASIALERPPADVHWTGSPANVKQAEHDLQKQTEMMENTQRKSLIHMNAQRKMLEKSMMAYSEKMKNISNYRTGDMPPKRALKPSKVRRDSDTQSLTGFSDSERAELPVNSGDLRRRRRRKIKHYRKREQMFSPIVEFNAKAEAPPTPVQKENIDFEGLRRALRRTSSADQIHPSDLLHLNTSGTEGNEPIPTLDYFSDSESYGLHNNVSDTDDGNYSILVLPPDTNNSIHAHNETNKTDSSVHFLPEIQITNSPLLGVPSASASRRGSASSNSSHGSSVCDDCSLKSYNSGMEGDGFNSPRSARSGIASSSLTSTPRSSTESLSKTKSKRKVKTIKDAFAADDSEAEMVLTVPRRHIRQRSNSKSKKDADTLLRTAVLKNAHRKSVEFGADHLEPADDSENWVSRSRAFTH